MRTTEGSALRPAEMAGAYWRKSSYSGASGTCVEVGDLNDGHCAVRDSKNPTGPVLILTPTEWTAFTTGVRDGQFD